MGVNDLTAEPDPVDYEVEALISVEDVDDTARYITHPAWSHYGDELKEI